MTKPAVPTPPPNPWRPLVATPLEGGATHVVIPGRRGTFAITADVPHPDREMIGPPPAYLSMAGWAA